MVNFSGEVVLTRHFRGLLMTIASNAYQSIQKEIPLLINRPYNAAGNTASRINRRVNRFLEMRTVERTDIITINVKR